MSKESSSLQEEQRVREEAIDVAEKLLKDVKPVSGEEPGRITRTRLRKMLALAQTESLYKAFRLKLLYLVQRNKSNQQFELEKFAESLRGYVEKAQDNRRQMERARLVLEYAIMVYASKEVS